MANASAASNLIIPIRMDVDKAIARSQKLSAQGKKAGDHIDTEAKKGKKSLDDMSDGAESAVEALLRLGKAQMGVQLINAVGHVISSEFKRAADYCKNLAMEFSDLRQMMQQVAALRGQQNTNEFTVSEAKKAAGASLTPQEWKSFQEQFQSYGGAYLEGDQARFIDREDSDEKYKERVQAYMKTNIVSEDEAMKVLPRKTITAAEQSEKYQQKIAEFGKARGIPADQIVQLGGALLQFSEGPQTTEGLMSRLGKVYKTLERAPTPVSELLTAMNRVMAQGSSPEEASQMLAIMSEAMSHEEETGVINTIKAITNETLEGRGDKLGQKKGMTRVEQIKAAVQSIKDRVDNGEDLDKIIHNIALNLRETKGIKGFLTQGLEAGGFDRTKGYQDETPTDFIECTLKDYEKSDAKYDEDETVTRAEAGERHEEVKAVLQRSRTHVVQSGDFEEGRMANLVHQAVGWWSGVDTEQQKINTEAIEELKEQGRQEIIRQRPRTLEQDMVRELRSSAAEETFGHGAQSQYQVNEEIRQLLRVIAENTGKDFSKVNSKIGKPGVPLAAPPAGGANKRQG
jgi:hypothetical protein